MAARDIESLHIEESGTGDPVLLLHGAGASASLFAPVAAELSASHRVIAIDRRGFSRSKGEPLGSLRLHAEDAAAVIAARTAGRAVVVGWSAGANTALHLAADAPERVAGLVLCEPSFLLRVPRFETIRALVGWETKRLFRGPEVGARAFYRWASQYRDAAPGESTNAFDAYPDAWRAEMIANHAPLFREARVGSGAAGETLDSNTLAGVEAPTIVLEGSRTAMPFRDGLGYLRSRLPRARFERVAGASHMIPTDRPDAVCAAVRALAKEGV